MPDKVTGATLQASLPTENVASPHDAKPKKGPRISKVSILSASDHRPKHATGSVFSASQAATALQLSAKKETPDTKIGAKTGSVRAGSEASTFSVLRGKSKALNAFNGIKPTPFVGKLRSQTKVVHDRPESSNKADLMKERLLKEGREWKELAKTGGGLFALAGRNIKAKVSGADSNDPAMQINKSSPGRKLARASLQKIFNADSKEQVKESFSKYLDSMRPNSSVNIEMSTDSEWGVRVPVGAIVALPVSPSFGVDVRHGRCTGFSIARQPDDTFNISISYNRSNGAGARVNVAPEVPGVDNSFLYGGVCAVGVRSDDRSILMPSQTLEQTSEFFEKYINHDPSIASEGEAVFSKTTKNSAYAWAAFLPGVYGDSIAEPTAAPKGIGVITKDFGGKRNEYSYNASALEPGRGELLNQKRLKPKSAVANPIFTFETGLGWSSGHVQDGLDFNPQSSATPSGPEPQTGDLTGSAIITGRFHETGGDTDQLTASKHLDRAKLKKPSARGSQSEINPNLRTNRNKNLVENLPTASRVVRPTRLERWGSEGVSGRKPEEIFGKKGAELIMKRAEAAIKKASGASYDIQKRSLIFTSQMSVKPESLKIFERHAMKEKGADYVDEVDKIINSALENPVKFKDHLNHNVSVTESKTYGQGGRFGIPFAVRVLENAKITFQRTFEIGNFHDKNGLVYDAQEFEESYGPVKKPAAPQPDTSGVELPVRNTVSTPPRLETIQEEAFEGDAGSAAGASDSIATFTQQDLDDILAPANRRD